MIKVIAIGNPILEDDAIALEVGKVIENTLNEDIIVYYEEIGEYNYMDEICTNDIIIILDGTNFNIDPGRVTFLNRDEVISQGINNFVLENINRIEDIDLYFIGIEIYSLSYKIGLSNVMRSNFIAICKIVESYIRTLLVKIDNCKK